MGENATLARRRYLHVCRRCEKPLVPGVDTSQFCREHQNEQNATNRASYRRTREKRQVSP